MAYDYEMNLEEKLKEIAAARAAMPGYGAPTREMPADVRSYLEAQIKAPGESPEEERAKKQAELYDSLAGASSSVARNLNRGSALISGIPQAELTPSDPQQYLKKYLMDKSEKKASEDQRMKAAVTLGDLETKYLKTAPKPTDDVKLALTASAQAGNLKARQAGEENKFIRQQNQFGQQDLNREDQQVYSAGQADKNRAQARIFKQADLDLRAELGELNYGKIDAGEKKDAIQNLVGINNFKRLEKTKAMGNWNSGPVTNFYNGFAQAFGVNDPDVARARQTTKLATVDYLHKNFGSAMTKLELSQGRDAVPDVSDDDEVFAAKVKMILEVAQENYKAQLNIIKASGARQETVERWADLGGIDPSELVPAAPANIKTPQVNAPKRPVVAPAAAPALDPRSFKSRGEFLKAAKGKMPYSEAIKLWPEGQ